MRKRNRSGFKLTEPLFPDDQATVAKVRQVDSSDFKREYLDHIRSAYWKRLSRKVKEKAQGNCARCNLHVHRLEVHHIHYETLGHETESDVVALCVACHHRADDERIRRTIQNSLVARDEARRAAAKDTFLSKLLSNYGDDYMLAYYRDPETYDRMFDEWYDRKLEEELNE